MTTERLNELEARKEGLYSVGLLRLGDEMDELITEVRRLQALLASFPTAEKTK